MQSRRVNAIATKQQSCPLSLSNNRPVHCQATSDNLRIFSAFFDTFYRKEPAHWIQPAPVARRAAILFCFETAPGSVARPRNRQWSMPADSCNEDDLYTTTQHGAVEEGRLNLSSSIRRGLKAYFSCICNDNLHGQFSRQRQLDISATK